MNVTVAELRGMGLLAKYENRPIELDGQFILDICDYIQKLEAELRPYKATRASVAAGIANAPYGDPFSCALNAWPYGPPFGSNPPSEPAFPFQPVPPSTGRGARRSWFTKLKRRIFGTA